MLKKIIIAGIILVALAVGAFIFIPSGQYESKLEKSALTNNTESEQEDGPPSLSLVQGNYAANTSGMGKAEILFDVDGLKKTKGAFEDFEIGFNIPENFENGELTVSIESASINTGNSMRDEHLAEEDFFHVEKYPEIKFAATKIEQTDTAYVAKGDLTLLETTKAIDVPFKHLGSGKSADGKTDFEAFEGNFEFDRTAYGMEEVSGTGNIVIVNFYCELIKQSAE